METPLSAADALGACGKDGWQYWRPDDGDIVEFGALQGGAPGLARHFHRETQMTLVLSGGRSLLTAEGPVELSTGRCLCIPGGVPHASRAESPDTVGLTAFIATGRYRLAEIVRDVERLWHPDSRSPLADLAALVRKHRRDSAAPDGDASDGELASREPIGRLAARKGLSREAFTRAFSKQQGMPPHAFRLAARLDRARVLLRAGTTIADVAAETGFADQSHFGRAFRRAFGVSPGRYRRG